MATRLDYRNLLASPEYEALLNTLTAERVELAEKLLIASEKGDTIEGAFLAGQIRAYKEVDIIARRLCKEEQNDQN